MSGIAGVAYTDGRPAQAETLLPTIAVMGFLGPDGVTTWVEGSVALAHLALHTTPEAAHERWPLRNARGDTLVADARLDNREELIRALGVEPRAAPPVTDADLILAAHERWGDAAPARLVGDFAYALWQPHEGTLRLARSPFGLRGLYYSVERGRVLFASTLRGAQALAPGGVLNLPWVASFLTRELDFVWDQTALTHIRKVPHAHLVTLQLDPLRETQQQFWDLRLSDEFAGWGDAEWAEAFRERFEQAVAAHLRSPAPIVMSSSGGLDSSSVALVAHRLMHEAGRVPTRPTHAYTLRMPGWPETDETLYQDAVFERLPGFETAAIPLERAWCWAGVEAWQRHMSTPSLFPNAWMFQPFFERAEARGCRVKLSGTGGDIVTGGEDYDYLEAFDSLGWAERWREMPHFARSGPGSYFRVGRRWLRDQLPSGPVRWWQRRRDPGLFTPRAGAAAARGPMTTPPAGSSTLQALMHGALMGPEGLQSTEQRAEVLALHGMELRAPFADRRLVELAFNQPLHLRFKEGQNRVLLKRVLANDLPPELLRRTSKADFTRFTAGSVSEADQARARQLPPGSLLRESGWIDEARWEQWTTHPQRPSQTVTTYGVAHLAQWLETIG